METRHHHIGAKTSDLAVEQGAGHDHALDLVGSLVDLSDFVHERFDVAMRDDMNVRSNALRRVRLRQSRRRIRVHTEEHKPDPRSTMPPAGLTPGWPQAGREGSGAREGAGIPSHRRRGCSRQTRGRGRSAIGCSTSTPRLTSRTSPPTRRDTCFHPLSYEAKKPPLSPKTYLGVV